MNRKFYKVSAIAGASKTTRAIELSIKHAAFGDLVLFIVPSIKKVDEIYKTIKEARDEPSYSLKKITSVNDSGISISDRITEETNSLLFQQGEFSRGGILVCTHEGFLLTQMIQNRELFHVFWDEAHTVARGITGKKIIDDFKKFLLDDFIEIEDVLDSEGKEVMYCEARVKRGMKDKLKERLTSKSIGIDDSETVRTLTGHLLSAANGLCEIRLHRCHQNSDELNAVFFYNQKPFEGFKSVTFLGALLEQTSLYKWFTMNGVEFEDHPEFQEVIKEKKHDVRLNIHYGNKTHRHSRRFLDRTIDGKRVRDIFRQASFDLFRKTEYSDKVLVMCNNDNKGLAAIRNEPIESSHYNFSPDSRYVKCPWNCEGINEFREIRNGMYIGSFNADSQYHQLIKKCGVDDFTSHYHFYQWLMRLACRNEDTKEVVSVSIPCLSLFEPLQEYFNMSKVNYIPLDVPDEMMEWVDKRTEDYKDRIETVNLPLEWYWINQEFLKSNSVPSKSSNQKYIKLLEREGFKKVILSQQYADGSKKYKSIIVMCMWPDGIEKAIKFFMNRGSNNPYAIEVVEAPAGWLK